MIPPLYKTLDRESIVCYTCLYHILKQVTCVPIYFSLSAPNLPLTLQSIGNHWEQEPVSRPKGYPFYHWLQTEQGCGTIAINGEHRVLHQGEGILLRSFCPHAYRRSGDSWSTCFLTFSGKLETEVHKIVGNDPFIFVGRQNAASKAAWIHDTIAAYESQQLDPVQLSVGCYAFLMGLSDSGQTRDMREQPLYRQYVEPMIKEIESRYSEALSLKSLAACVYVSPQYLSRLSRRFLGCSPYAYLTQHRMNKAKELLATQPHMEMQQVAYRVGYRNSSHFIAMFKQATGLTPLEFRRLH